MMTDDKAEQWRFWMKRSGAGALCEEFDRLRALLASIKACVDAQAEDPALWVMYPTIGEAYLQQELRRLHAVIEGEILPGVEKETT